MKTFFKNLKGGLTFGLGILIMLFIGGIVFASLNNVEEGDILSAQKWNELVGNVNDLSSINGDYSTEEIFTGNYWIDGKPIYRKVFNGITGNAVTGWNDLGISIAELNIEQLIDGWAIQSKDSVPDNFTGDWGIQVGIKKSTNTLSIYHDYSVGIINFTDIPHFLVIEYTKTID